MKNFKIYNKNIDLYTNMLSDIKNAKKFIYLETYIFNNDSIGKKFNKILTRKAKEGVEVRLLLDDIGSTVKIKHFEELLKNGGHIKFFRKFKFHYRMISSNNYRDHRKILVIDDTISYIGSSNIFEKSLSWRDLSIRFEGNISPLFAISFLKNYDIANKHVYKKREHTEILAYGKFEIVRDVPSVRLKKIRRKEIELIDNSKKNIYIETPYFIPDRKLRRHLKRASRRGVEINIVLPIKSDVYVINTLRQRYFGKLHIAGIKILFYKPSILHSKLMIVDNSLFTVGSANLDNRSSLFQYEINLFGNDKEIISSLNHHASETMAGCIQFDYNQWQNRSLLQKTLEKILNPIKYLL